MFSDLKMWTSMILVIPVVLACSSAPASQPANIPPTPPLPMETQPPQPRPTSQRLSPALRTAPDPENAHLDSVILLPHPETSAQPTYLFSVDLPDGWEINNPRTGIDSWGGGSLDSDGITLTLQSGAFAVGELYEITGTGPMEKDDDMAAQHVVTEETIGGMSAILVRPREGVEGVTGAIVKIMNDSLLITGENLSRDEQETAFRIIRTIRQ
jgi:hypothetical protein